MASKKNGVDLSRISLPPEKEATPELLEKMRANLQTYSGQEVSLTSGDDGRPLFTMQDKGGTSAFRSSGIARVGRALAGNHEQARTDNDYVHYQSQSDVLYFDLKNKTLVYDPIGTGTDKVGDEPVQLTERQLHSRVLRASKRLDSLTKEGERVTAAMNSPGYLTGAQRDFQMAVGGGNRKRKQIIADIEKLSASSPSSESAVEPQASVPAQPATVVAVSLSASAPKPVFQNEPKVGPERSGEIVAPAPQHNTDSVNLASDAQADKKAAAPARPDLGKATDAMFANWDKDKDGFLSKQEAYDGAKVRQEENRGKKNPQQSLVGVVNKNFDRFDVEDKDLQPNKDLKLSRKEVRQGMEALMEERKQNPRGKSAQPGKEKEQEPHEHPEEKKGRGGRRRRRQAQREHGEEGQEHDGAHREGKKGLLAKAADFLGTTKDTVKSAIFNVLDGKGGDGQLTADELKAGGFNNRQVKNLMKAAGTDGVLSEKEFLAARERPVAQFLRKASGEQIAQFKQEVRGAMAGMKEGTQDALRASAQHTGEVQLASVAAAGKQPEQGAGKGGGK